MRPNINTGAYPSRRVFDVGSAPGYGSLDRIVGVNLYAGTDIDVIADKQSAARAVEYNVRVNPTILADSNITKDQYIVIARGAFAKSIVGVRPAVLDIFCSVGSGPSTPTGTGNAYHLLANICISGDPDRGALLSNCKG